MRAFFEDAPAAVGARRGGGLVGYGRALLVGGFPLGGFTLAGLPHRHRGVGRLGRGAGLLGERILPRPSVRRRLGRLGGRGRPSRGRRLWRVLERVAPVVVVGARAAAGGSARLGLGDRRRGRRGGATARRRGRHVVVIVVDRAAGLAGGDRLLRSVGERIVPARRTGGRLLPARRRRRGGRRRGRSGREGRRAGPRGRAGRRWRGAAAGRGCALHDVDDSIVAFGLRAHRNGGRLGRRLDLGLGPLGRFVFDLGLRHRRRLVRRVEQRVDVVGPLAPALRRRLGRFLGRQEIVESLVVGGRRLLLLGRFVLEQLVDELVVAVFDRRRRRGGRARLQLGRDLAGFALAALTRILVGQRRQRHFAAPFARLRLRRRGRLLRGGGLGLFLVARGLLGGRFFDRLRTRDVVELAALVIRPHHGVFPLQLLADHLVVAESVSGLFLRRLFTGFGLRIGGARGGPDSEQTDSGEGGTNDKPGPHRCDLHVGGDTASYYRAPAGFDKRLFTDAALRCGSV